MDKFSIKEIEAFTGIKAHTIRIWEQRYNLISPSRSDTNIRTYSNNDLKLLLNVSLLNNKGHKISNIAKLGAEEINKIALDYSVNYEDSSESVNTMKLAMLDFDEQVFIETLNKSIVSKGLESTFRELVIPFITQIGYLWQTNVICPAHEHFVSNLIRQKLYALVDQVNLNTKRNAKRYVIFLPEHESHELSLLYINYYVKSKLDKTIYLGQNVPFEDLLELRDRVDVNYFISIFTTYPSENLLEEYLRQIESNFPVHQHFYLTGHILANYKGKLPRNVSVFESVPDLLAQLPLGE